MTEINFGHQSDRNQNPFKGMTKTKKAKIDKKETPPTIHLGEHGRYQIKSGLIAGKFLARAFAKPPTQARGVIAEASGISEEAAIAALRDIIDARETRRVEDRRQDPRTEFSVPSVEEYSEALGHVALTRPQRAMLTALMLAESNGLTAIQLARAAGYTSLPSANRSLANAGRLISDFLTLKTHSKKQPNALEGISILAFRGEPEVEADPGRWILYPEMRDAVKASL